MADETFGCCGSGAGPKAQPVALREGDAGQVDSALIKLHVRQVYSQRARGVSGSCCPSNVAEEVGADLPDTAVSYGCGNPLALGEMRPGEVVLDLGSGPGRDCLLAARAVGATGRVIGVDFSDDMLELARRNARAVGATNVEFRKGDIEALPAEDAGVDVVISNCVINLAPDKRAVFREAARVLCPGGRFHVADVVLLRDLTAPQRADLDAWAGCVSGAIAVDEYRAGLVAAGFREVTIDVEPGASGGAWASAHIRAVRG